MIPWRWWMSGYASTACGACASWMPRSCPPSPGAIPISRRSWSLSERQSISEPTIVEAARLGAKELAWMNIHTYLATASVDLAGLADYLDRLEAAARLREVRSL